jgi:hypothetical protein
VLSTSISGPAARRHAPAAREIAALIICLWAVPAVAQTPGPAPATSPPAASPDEVRQMDVADLLRRIRGKPDPPDEPGSRMLVLSPVIGARPVAGAFVGAAGNVAFHLGKPETTRISSAVGSFTVSTAKQVSLTARTTAFGSEERWRVETDYRLQWTSQEMFGLGMPPPLDDAQLTRFDYLRLYQSVFREAAPFLHIGGGLYFDRHANVRPDDEDDPQWASSPYVEYSTANGFPLDTQTSAGVGGDVVWDSRDNFINPDKGVLARGGYKVFLDDFLGGSSTWGRVNVDLRAYPSLGRSPAHKLAMWLYADLVAHGTAPYFHLPSTANDTFGRSGRGYAEGHFRGEKLTFAELEYRGRLTANGLLGMVVFANATAVADTSHGQALFDRVAPGGGAGLRVLMNKRSRTNIAVDVGFGERGNRGIYLAIQEAF